MSFWDDNRPPPDMPRFRCLPCPGCGTDLMGEHRPGCVVLLAREEGVREERTERDLEGSWCWS